MAGEETERALVVVGVDGSAESVAALRWAKRNAAVTGAQVRAILCWHYPSAVGPAPVGVAPEAVTGQVRHQMEQALAAAVAEVYPDQGAAAAVQTKISYGHPAQALIDESEKADLLVVGRHGHGAFTQLFVGSVSMHCVSHATCPVVVIRSAWPASPDPGRTISAGG